MDLEENPSRGIVKLLSWVGLALGVLSVLEGVFLGSAQVFLSVIGLYVTWSDTLRRQAAACIYALGWTCWAVMDSAYLLVLLGSCFKPVSSFLVGVISSWTFQNLSPMIQSTLDTLSQDVNGFVIFAAVTRIVFDWFCAHWGIVLWKNILSHGSRLPLMSAENPTLFVRPVRADFGSTQRTGQQPQPPPRARTIPFQGKGHRLGAD